MIDLVVTVALFAVASLPLPLLPFVALTSVMIGDNGASTTRTRAVAIVALGVPLVVVTILAVAVIVALRADGPTFYIPVVALVAELVAGAAVIAVALRVHARGLPV